MIEKYSFLEKKEDKSISPIKKQETSGLTEFRINDKVYKVDFKVIDKNVVTYGAAKIY